MSVFDDTLQRIVNMDDGEKMALAASSFRDVYPAMCRFDDEPDADGHYIFTIILAGVLAADGKFNEYELGMAAGIMKAVGYVFSSDELANILAKILKGLDVYKIIGNFNNTLDEDENVAFVTLVATICSIDDRISKEEVALIRDLLEG